MIKKQFLKFIVIGVFSTIINYACFYALMKFFSLNYLLASATGFIAGTLAGYGLNKSWTFGVSNSQDKYIFKYFLVYCISLILSVIVLKGLVSLLLMKPELANVIVIGMTTCTNFLGVKFLVFKS
jgi:putative flippase GtrA